MTCTQPVLSDTVTLGLLGLQSDTCGAQYLQSDGTPDEVTRDRFGQLSDVMVLLGKRA